MSRRLAALALVASAVAARQAWSGNAPHDQSSPAPTECNSCHVLHKALGDTLTTQDSNANTCFSCHSLPSTDPKFRWNDDYQAVPGAQGRSHRWDSPAVNPQAGATLPLNAEVLARVNANNGNLLCSACHDQHTGASTYRGRQHVGPSVTIGSPVTRTAGTGSGTLIVNQPNASANPKGYRVEVVVGGTPPTAKFRVSNDNAGSWWGAPAWTANSATGVSTGTAVALNDGTFVTVTFTGTFVAGDRWDFYVSYPFLRMSVDNSELCETCHSSRVQTSLQQESGGDGGFVFSHPVGEALSKPYDRLGGQGAILDANGKPQSVGDDAGTNDLRLDTQGKVRCLTCHLVHNSDSNGLTEDPL